MHTCEICGWTTNRIGNLRAHLAKQKKCKPPPVQEPEPPPPITLYANQCAKCEKILSAALCLKNICPFVKAVIFFNVLLALNVSIIGQQNIITSRISNVNQQL